jgi:hypothetical protein
MASTVIDRGLKGRVIMGISRSSGCAPTWAAREGLPCRPPRLTVLTESRPISDFLPRPVRRAVGRTHKKAAPEGGLGTQPWAAQWPPPPSSDFTAWIMATITFCASP